MIFRRLRPVYWSPSSRTALAEAELEYKEDHISTAVYVKFPLVELGDLSKENDLTIGELNGFLKKGSKISAVIWTTTPWTLPANRVALQP
jgi:isoleucyl-tRNA synthetase